MPIVVVVRNCIVVVTSSMLVAALFAIATVRRHSNRIPEMLKYAILPIPLFSGLLVLQIGSFVLVPRIADAMAPHQYAAPVAAVDRVSRWMPTVFGEIERKI